MRNASIAVAAGLTLLCVSTALHGQARDAPIDPRSMQLFAQGQAARAAGQLDAADDALEGAVAVDPRNRDAFVALGAVAAEQGLPGKAIARYRDALMLDPRDTAALRGQGVALLAKGAVSRAEANLARIRAACHGDCPDAVALAAAVAKGPPVVTAQAVPPTSPNERASEQ